MLIILLEVTLSNGWLTFIIVSILLIFIYLIANKSEIEKRRKESFYKTRELEQIIKANEELNKSVLNEKISLYQKQVAEQKVSSQNWAINEFERFKQTELDLAKKELKEQSLKAAGVLLQQWKIENEAKIRNDAINRSYSVNLGKITEHLIPFHKAFLSQFNPKDARFIGSPIDLIVFDGYADKKDEIIIYFVEVKSGNSKLTEIQKKIKECVIKGEIRWAEINPDKENIVRLAEPKIVEDNQQLNLFKRAFNDEALIKLKILNIKGEVILIALTDIDKLIVSGYEREEAILKIVNKVTFKDKNHKKILIELFDETL